MNHPNFLEWSKEEKDRYASEKLRQMRQDNIRIEQRHVEVERDRRAAEDTNSSVTNSANAQKPGASSERCRPKRVDRNVSRYPREWDRGKESGEWEAHSPKAYRNYRTSDYERRNLRNESRTSARSDRNYRSDHVPDKKNKHYNKNQHNRYDGSSKQNWYQSSESSRKLQHQRDKNKRYFSSDTKHHIKHQSNQSNQSSTDSEYMNDKWNKPRNSDTEASALWHSERMNEDKNKLERCIKWVEDSVPESNLEEERIPADEEEKANSNPKKKLEKFETTSDKCLNDYNVHSVGSSSTKVTQKTQVLRKSYTKFDRINRSDHSSDDSDSNWNLESNKKDYTENDNSNLEKEHFKCSMKLENEPSEEKSPEENEEPSNSEKKFTESKCETKSSLYNPESQFVKRSSENQRYSPVRKVYSHNDGYVISRAFTCSDRGCNEKDFKKGSKAKRNPQTNLQYNSSESCKNEHISKQRKFDKGQSKEALDNQRYKWNRQYFVSFGNKNRSMKAETCTSDKKRPNFNVVHSLNEDDGSWGNIVQSQVEDEGDWSNNVQSQVDDDDGIWASTDQSDIKWEINEDCNTKQKSAKKNSRGHDKKEAKAFKEHKNIKLSEYMNDKWNKPRNSDAEASALWHSERMNEDKNKLERCIKWVEDSVPESNLEEERIPADEEEKANSNPKKKLEKFETTSDKCLNDYNVHSVGSSSTKVTQKTQVLRKSYTKFDRINRSDHSSDDSDSNWNLESNKKDYTENDNSNLEKEHFKCSMKLENEPSEEKSPEENEEPSNSEKKFTESKCETKSSLYNPESQFVKRSSENQRYSPVRKVYSHNDGYVISRAFTCSDRGCNEKDFKKGSKAKRNPQTNLQYNSPESCKNEHISKQRKFDKGQSKEALDNQRYKWNRQYFVSFGNKNRSMKAETCTSDKKRPNFNVVHSLNEDDGSWGNIVQSQVEDEGDWSNNVQSQVDDDDGIWASTDQSDIKWEINEDCNTKQKSAKKNSRGHDKKEAKAFKVKYPIGSDDGGWSTVDEGEMKSDDM